MQRYNLSVRNKKKPHDMGWELIPYAVPVENDKGVFVKYGDVRLKQLNTELAAVDIVQELIGDIINRKGLGNEWERYDQETKEEIKDTWIEIIESYLRDNRLCK